MEIIEATTAQTQFEFTKLENQFPNFNSKETEERFFRW